jgi:hypothetical protein
MDKKHLRSDGRLWRYLTNFWTLIFFFIIIVNFIHHNAYEAAIQPISIIYIACLAIYSAEKEFERWQFYFIGKHPGEIYVAVWTVLICSIFIINEVTAGEYVMNSEIVASYIAVLGILAITRKSKTAFKEKCKK